MMTSSQFDLIQNQHPSSTHGTPSPGHNLTAQSAAAKSPNRSRPPPATINGFTSSITYLKSLVTMLSPLTFKKRGIVFLNEEGLCLIAQDSKAIQGKSFIPKSLFRSFLNDEDVHFLIDLSCLLECLTLFGTPVLSSSKGTSDNLDNRDLEASAFIPQAGTPPRTSFHTSHSSYNIKKSHSNVTARFSYEGLGSELKLMLEEDNVSTLCYLSTYEAEEELVDFSDVFAMQPDVGRVIMKSEWLSSAFAEIDSSVSEISLTLSPSHPFFRIEAQGIAGEVCIDYPKDTDALQSFTCDRPMTQKYKLSLVKHCFKALSLSQKTSIKMNAVGVLNLQFMIGLENSNVGFIDFTVLPLVEEIE